MICKGNSFCSYWSVSYDVLESVVNQCFENASASHTFSAKERDSETGLSYFGSRYYSSDLSIWLSVDPMASKYPSLSPYVYCADNPVKLVDPNGEDWVEREVEGRKEVYYDRSVKSQADVNKKYGESSGVRHLADGTKVGNGQYTVYNDHKGNKNGVVKDANGNTINPDRTIIYGKGYTLFAGVTDESVNAESLHNNMFGSSYIGADNPKSYNGEDNYDYQPTWSPTEMAAYRHDKAYDAVGAEGVSGALLNQRTKCADQCLIYECKNIAKDPKTNASERSRAQKIAFGFSCIDFIFKTPRF
ncbi:MAG: RHS repeat-associated core domain-containing protein [Bacteroidales bacterium]|nr:RHS repeat-associated core domain-containing protein [Bacteroidales bacterium]